MNLAQSDRTPKSEKNREQKEPDESIQDEYETNKNNQSRMYDADIGSDGHSNMTGSPSNLRWRNVKKKEPAFAIVTVPSTTETFILNDAAKPKDVPQP